MNQPLRELSDLGWVAHTRQRGMGTDLEYGLTALGVNAARWHG